MVSLNNNSQKTNGNSPEAVKPSVPVADKSQSISQSQLTETVAELNDAMRGGLIINTGESAVHDVLRGKSTKQIKQIASEYDFRFGKGKFKEHLKDSFKGTERASIKARLKGEHAKADGLLLKKELNKTFTSDEKVLSLLRNSQNPAELEKHAGQNVKQRLKSELSKSEYKEAVALLKDDKVTAETANLKRIAKDPEKLANYLATRNASEIEVIRKAAPKIDQHVSKMSDPVVRAKAQAGLAQDKTTLKAIKAVEALDKTFMDREAIKDAYRGTTTEQRSQMMAKHKELTGKDLTSHIKKEYGAIIGNDERLELEQTLKIVERGTLSAEEQVYYDIHAKEGEGGKLEEHLSTLSHKQIQEFAEKYESINGSSLQRDVEVLSGTAEFEGKMTLRGKSTSVEETVARAQERADYATKGVGGFLTGLVTDKDNILENNAARLQSELAQAKSNGSISAEEQQNINRLSGHVTQDSSAMIDTREQVAETGAAVVGGVVAGVATVATGGLAAGLAGVALTAGAGTAAGATSYTVAKASIQGSQYDTADLAKDVAIGAVAGVGGAAGASAGRAVSVMKGLVGRQAVIRNVGRALSEAGIEGAVSGTGEALVHNPTNVSTALTAGIAGMLGGGVMLGLQKAGGKVISKAADKVTVGKAKVASSADTAATVKTDGQNPDLKQASVAGVKLPPKPIRNLEAGIEVKPSRFLDQVAQRSPSGTCGLNKVEMDKLASRIIADMKTAAGKDTFASQSVPHINELQSTLNEFFPKDNLAALGLNKQYMDLLVQGHDMGKFIPATEVLGQAKKMAGGNAGFEGLLGFVSMHDVSTAVYLKGVGKEIGIPESKIADLTADIVGHNDGSGLKDVFWNSVGWNEKTMGAAYPVPQRLEGDVLAFIDRFGQGSVAGSTKIFQQITSGASPMKLKAAVTEAFHDNPKNTIRQMVAISERLSERASMRSSVSGSYDFKATELYQRGLDIQSQTMIGNANINWSNGANGEDVARILSPTGDVLAQARNVEELLSDNFQDAMFQTSNLAN